MNPANPGSIRTRLMRLQWLALLLVGGVCGVVSFALTWRTVNDLRDQTLEQVAQSVVRHGLEVEGEDNAPDVPDQGQFTSQIWTEDDTLHYTSTDDGPPRQQPGWHKFTWQGQEWHVYTLVQDGLTIQVSQPGQSREHTFWQVAPPLALALVLVTAVLYGLLHWAASASLKPLHALRQHLASANPSAPLSPLAQQAWPTELQPLVGTLDELFGRLAQAREAQQHLVARAAHEFRTPLAALKIHTQLLGRHTPEPPDPALQARHREHLLHAVDRMARLVDQLLKLAEFDAHAALPPPLPLEVGPWLASHSRLWQALAEAKGLTLTLDLPPHAVVVGHSQALHALLDNLVHNAVRHGPPHSTVRLSLALSDHQAVWQVSDQGPGMTPAQRAQVGQTFVALPGVHAEGSGLGLAIATRVAALHHGTLALTTTPGGGLTVEVRLPQPQAPSAPGQPGSHAFPHQQA